LNANLNANKLSYVNIREGNSRLFINTRRISVIIPVFNTEETLLRQAIESVLQQSFTDFELILVNDCGTNCTPEILEYYAKTDSRVKLIHNARNMGCPQSRKEGLQHARGEYILFSDADNYLEKEMLAEMYKTATDGDFDMIYCDYFKHSQGKVQTIVQGEFSDTATSIKHIFDWTAWGVIWNKLVKRSLYDNLVFPTAFIHEDEVISTQLFAFAERVGYVSKPLYHYIFNCLYSNITADGVRQCCENYNFIIDFLKARYGENLSAFEPELSDRINYFKMNFLQQKALMDLYPPSLHNKTSKISEFVRWKFFCRKYRMPFLPFRVWMKSKKIMRFYACPLRVFAYGFMSSARDFIRKKQQ
jgi:glycosyltransferase involved in cell wall biosynthesis